MKTVSIMKEKDLQTSILQYLKARGIFAWKNHTTGIYDPKRNKYRTVGMKGVSDILGLLPDGRFLAVECKSATGRLTGEQVEFIGEVNRRNGFAIFARSIEDVRSVLDFVLGTKK